MVERDQHDYLIPRQGLRVVNNPKQFREQYLLEHMPHTAAQGFPTEMPRHQQAPYIPQAQQKVNRLYGQSPNNSHKQFS